MTDYTASVVMWVLLIAFLVGVLLIGGILILNLGLMSKRETDHIGGRTPSDVGILKNSVWPPEPTERRILPAEEDEDQSIVQELREVPGPSQSDHDKPQSTPPKAA